MLISSDCLFPNFPTLKTDGGDDTPLRKSTKTHFFGNIMGAVDDAFAGIFCRSDPGRVINFSHCGALN